MMLAAEDGGRSATLTLIIDAPNALAWCMRLSKEPRPNAGQDFRGYDVDGVGAKADSRKPSGFTYSVPTSTSFRQTLSGPSLAKTYNLKFTTQTQPTSAYGSRPTCSTHSTNMHMHVPTR